jgi:tetratricopeptide (TPR) repeat protein
MTSLLFGCAGSAEKTKPSHLSAGMAEVTKGTGWYQKGCYKRSLEHFLKAHELFAVSDQLDGVAMSLNNIGNVYRALGEIKSALLFYDEALNIYRDMENFEETIQVLANRAAALIDENRLSDAERVLEQIEAIALQRKISLGSSHKIRGILYLKKKEFAEAELALKRSLEVTSPENLFEFAAVNFALGNLMIETGNYEKAEDYLTAALDADRESGLYSGIAGDLEALGLVYTRLNKHDLSAKFYKRCIQVYALLENAEKIRVVMEQLEKAAETAGVDTSITKHFVTRWLDGKAYISPCK